MSSYTTTAYLPDDNQAASHDVPASLTDTFSDTTPGAPAVNDNLNLVLRYQQTATPDKQHEHEIIGRQIARAYRNMCHLTIKKTCPAPENFSCLTFDDLMNQTQLAVLKAALRFDPAKGATFETFIQQRIKGAIIDMLREPGTLNFRQSRRENEIIRAWVKFAEAATRDGSGTCPHHLRAQFIASVKERHIHMEDDEIEEVLSLAELRNIPILQHDDTDASSGVAEDAISDHDANNPEDLVGAQEAHALALATVNAAFEHMTMLEKCVTLERLFGVLNLKEIGAKYGFTESRAGQLVRAGYEKLERQMRQNPETAEMKWQDLPLVLSEDMNLIISPPVLAADSPLVDMPATLDTAYLAQLEEWHFEKTGRRADKGSKTPVWLKLEDGSWARGNTTWPEVITRQENEITTLESHHRTSMQLHNLRMALPCSKPAWF